MSSTPPPSELKLLRQELELERYKNAQLAAQLARQKLLNETLQAQAEKEEEAIANRLMKRLDDLKREKEMLARQVEMEEEMITNKLSKKLDKVKKEKVELENLLEQEQEFIVNKLQKQLSHLLDEKKQLESQLHEVPDAILHTLRTHLERWRLEGDPVPPELAAPAAASGGGAFASASGSGASSSDAADYDAASEGRDSEAERTNLLVNHIAAMIDLQGEAQQRYRRKYEVQQQQNEALKHDLARLQSENSTLQHRVAREREIRALAQAEHARFEANLEIETERSFNAQSSAASDISSSIPGSPKLPATPLMNVLSPGSSPRVSMSGGCRPISLFTLSSPTRAERSPSDSLSARVPV